MKLPSLKRVSLVAGALGTLAPIAIVVIQALARSVPDIALYFWPTWGLLMATDGHEREFSSYLIMAASVVANAAIYVLVFALVWGVAWVIRAWRASLRDGTTI
jgi:hypothetical protein